MGVHFSPFIFQIIYLLPPPIQYKGGVLWELFKGKGQRCDMAAYRDVTVCNTAIKPHCKLLRKQGMKPLTGITSETQFGGGLNGGSTDFPRLYLDAARTIARKHKLSLACIYIDLKSAFASIVRGIALQHLLCPEDRCYRLAKQGLDSDDISCITERL